MDNSIKHVAIIMDGNGRWAKQKFRPRVWGHIRGSKIVNTIVESASNQGLKALTLYAFSTENWSRPGDEVSTLFKLLKKFLIKEREQIKNNGIQFKVIGDISKLNTETQKLINDVEEESKNSTGLMLSFAFSYGGRIEIVDAVNKYIKENPGKELKEEDIQKNLYRPEAGDVDLMIRTGGDQRISNFLLWEVCYAELFFTNTKWPDFTKKEFESIIEKVSGHDRRFGSLDNKGSLEKSKELSKNFK
jgi:undecaprenyl diphosphate synthase